MPEGVEILIQVNKLKTHVGKTIVEIKWNNKFQKRGVNNPQIVKLPLIVVDIWSRGKIIVFETKDACGEILYITSQLGMSGYWTTQQQKHSNLWLGFGEKSLTNPVWIIHEYIWYDDTRHFGIIGFYRELKNIWKKHGPCLMLTALVNQKCLNPKQLNHHQQLVTCDFYKSQIRNKRFNKDKRIAEFMMDQSRVSGVGNYLRAEILYQARIIPTRLLSSLSDNDIKTLFDATLDVMYRSYTHKGGYYVGIECGAGFEKLIYKKPKDPNGYQVNTFPDKNERMCYFVSEIQI